MKRKWMVLLCALSLLAAAGCQKEADYQTVTPEVGTIENRVEDTGTVAWRDPFGHPGRQRKGRLLCL